MASKENNTEREQNEQDENKKISGSPDVPDSMSIEIPGRDPEQLKQDASYRILAGISDIKDPEQINPDTTQLPDKRNTKDQDQLIEDDELEIVMGTEADVTAEDLILLGDPDQDMIWVRMN